MLASYTFRPKTSVYSKNAAVDSAFIYPLYKGRVAFNYGVLYIVAFCTFAAFSQHHFYLLSIHLAMYIVDLHLYQWPPILYYLSGALLAQHRFFTYYCSSSCVSCSFFTACRRRVSWLINLGVVAFRGLLFLVYNLIFSVSSSPLGGFVLQILSAQQLPLYIHLLVVLLLYTLVWRVVSFYRPLKFSIDINFIVSLKVLGSFLLVVYCLVLYPSRQPYNLIVNSKVYIPIYLGPHPSLCLQ